MGASAAGEREIGSAMAGAGWEQRGQCEGGSVCEGGGEIVGSCDGGLGSLAMRSGRGMARPCQDLVGQ